MLLVATVITHLVASTHGLACGFNSWLSQWLQLFLCYYTQYLQLFNTSQYFYTNPLVLQCTVLSTASYVTERYTVIGLHSQSTVQQNEWLYGKSSTLTVIVVTMY